MTEPTPVVQGDSPALDVPCAQCGRTLREHVLLATALRHVFICPRSVYQPEP